jgi:hypothetical protein
VNGSGRVTTVTATGADGESTATGAAVRKALGLRSTWFSVGVVALTPPADSAPLVYGGRTKLSGLARSVSQVGLEQRAATSGAWAVSGRVKPAADGTLAVPVKPTVSTWYRLAVGTLRTAPVRVAVAPRVQFDLPAGAESLRGLARPVLPKALVEIQRRGGTAWRTVARTRVDASGAFAASVQLHTGTYRARVTPGRGFVPGLTKPLEVVSGRGGSRPPRPRPASRSQAAPLRRERPAPPSRRTTRSRRSSGTSRRITPSTSSRPRCRRCRATEFASP